MTSTAARERHHESGQASIMDIDNNILAALIHDELHKTFQVNGRWRDCSDKMQRLWEEAVHEALVRAARLEGDENGPATVLLKKLSTATGERPTDFYTLAAVLYEQLLLRYESGVAFFGLGVPWERRSEKAQGIWTTAIRRALSRTALGSENPGGEEFCFHVFRESADQPYVRTPRPAPAEGEQPPAPPSPASKRPWWKFWR